LYIRREVKEFRIGWFGDQGFGERVIQMILSGRKTATARPTYDPWEPIEVGEKLAVTDKHGKKRGVIQITKIETRLWSEFDAPLIQAEGMPMDELKEHLAFANSHQIRADEEMRVEHFVLLDVVGPPAPPPLSGPKAL
jgi:uncharacterized protein YhfF